MGSRPDQRSRVGDTAWVSNDGPLGSPRSWYTFDGTQYLFSGADETTALANAEAARKVKVAELLGDLKDLRSALRSWITIINLPYSQVTPGKAIALWCDGGGPESTRFLNGITGSATVDLQETMDPSGTQRRVDDGGPGAIMLYCLGGGPEPHRYLNGPPQGLSPTLVDDSSYTGAHWQVSDGGGGAVLLFCDTAGGTNHWLNGVTGDASSNLHPSGSLTSGAFWRVLPLG
jgi:hypothetical protein